VPIKSCVRGEGGIDPLVHLLESFDAKVLHMLCPVGCSIALLQEDSPCCVSRNIWLA